MYQSSIHFLNKFKAMQFGLLVLLGTSVSGLCFAGAQVEEPLSNSVKALMQRSVSDRAVPTLTFATQAEGELG